MKITLLAVSAAFAAFVSAQNTGVPQCAQKCVTDLLPPSCNTNPECICKDSTFISNISCCVFNACPASDQTAALNFAKSVCTPVGVTLPAQAGCAASASGSGSTLSGTATGAATATSPRSVSSAASSASSAVTSAASSAASSASSAASSASTAAATSRAAGEKLAANGMGLFGAIVGAVALL